MIGSARARRDRAKPLAAAGRSPLRRSALALALAAALAPTPARPAAFDVESRTEAQADTISGAGDAAGRALLRRRLVQTVDLAGFELVSGEDAGLHLALRVDSDFAVSARDARAVTPDPRERLQLLAARLHWRGLSSGRVDVEAGRLRLLDAGGFRDLDGARVTVRPARALALSAVAGLRVTGTSWLASPTFAPDGPRDAGPSLSDPAPSYGLRAAWLGPSVSAEAGWLRTNRRGDVLEERGSAAVRLRAGVEVEAFGEYDLFVRRLTLAGASARVPLGPALRLGAELVARHETFAADAIWNVFDTAPFATLTGRLDVAPPGAAWRGYASVRARRQSPSAGAEALLGDRTSATLGGAAGAWLALGRTTLSVDLAADGTALGAAQPVQQWIAASARRRVREWLALDARAAAVRVHDPAAIDRDGWYASGSVGATARLERRAELAVLLEDATPRNDLRLFALLVLGADFDGRLR